MNNFFDIDWDDGSSDCYRKDELVVDGITGRVLKQFKNEMCTKAGAKKELKDRTEASVAEASSKRERTQTARMVEFTHSTVENSSSKEKFLNSNSKSKDRRKNYKKAWMHWARSVQRKRCHETDSSDSEDKYQYTHVNTGENSGISSFKSNYESNKDQGILSDDEMAACENDSISDSNQVSQSESELWNAIDQQIVISSDSGDNSEIPKSKQLTSWAKNWYEDGSSHPNFEMFYLQRDEIVTEGIIDLNAATEKLIQTVRERTEVSFYCGECQRRMYILQRKEKALKQKELF
ncbi:uncharacterized protein [Mytilus edulis]|uniref:uncharacterized protein n=1 Tax=Mytilus edulis TaxID=6550 RepID=UPI0039EEEF41